jgi:hypothetical protein
LLIVQPLQHFKRNLLKPRRLRLLDFEVSHAR